jgi:hypothetical protein
VGYEENFAEGGEGERVLEEKDVLFLNHQKSVYEIETIGGLVFFSLLFIEENFCK